MKKQVIKDENGITNEINHLNTIINVNVDTSDQQSILEKICNTKGGKGSKWNEWERTMHELIVTKEININVKHTFDYDYAFWYMKEKRKSDKELYFYIIKEIKSIEKTQKKNLLWCLKEREDSRAKNKRSELKYIPLNEKFEGSERHHVDKEHIIYIQKRLHRSVYHNIWNGNGMEEINKLAWNSLKET